jgi:hypothetical protein
MSNHVEDNRQHHQKDDYFATKWESSSWAILSGLQQLYYLFAENVILNQ